MMNQIQIFSNPQFGDVRTIEQDGEFYFLVADIALILGYSRSAKAAADHCDAKDVLKWDTLTKGGYQSMTYVNESGLYALVMGSKLSQANEFKQWVTSEVLPAIRKDRSPLSLPGIATSYDNMRHMTSLQIAGITGKQHKDVLEAIRNMEPAWVKVNGRKFPLVEYKDAKGEMRPMYQLYKTECLYIATKFNDEARAKLRVCLKMFKIKY